VGPLRFLICPKLSRQFKQLVKYTAAPGWTGTPAGSYLRRLCGWASGTGWRCPYTARTGVSEDALGWRRYATTRM